MNRASRYCDGARGGAVLISREMYEVVFGSVEVKEVRVNFKHEGVVKAFNINGDPEQTLDELRLSSRITSR